MDRVCLIGIARYLIVLDMSNLSWWWVRNGMHGTRNQCLDGFLNAFAAGLRGVGWYAGRLEIPRGGLDTRQF